jgi:peroxiredoxin
MSPVAALRDSGPPPEMAPPLTVSGWVNTPQPITLDGLRGRVVLLEAFQMLCPGCVAHGIPLAQRVATTFASAGVTVLGLHSVFEHHAVQGSREALEAFVHEYRITFPIALDAPSDRHPLPRTMRAYGMRGTPTLILIDRAGRARHSLFGVADELTVGYLLGSLLAERDRGAD